MKSGDVVLFKGRSVVSKIISMFTKSEFTHVAIAINERSIVEADRFVNVRIRNVDDKQIHKVLRCTDIDDIQRVAIAARSVTMVGTKYDYAQVVLWFLRILFNYKRAGIINNANRVFCSELVDRVYQMEGIDLVPDRGEGDVLVTHIMNSPLLTEVK
jgi:hypothetical protein